MRPYTTRHPNTNIENRMKIEHTTYDACRKIRPKRLTAAEKIKNFFQKDSHRKYELEADGKRVRFDLPCSASRQSAQRIPGSANTKQRPAQDEGNFKCQRQGQPQPKRRTQEEATATTRVPLYEWASNRPAGRSAYQIGDGKIPKKLTRNEIRPVQSKFTALPTIERLGHVPNKRLELEPPRCSPVVRPTHASRPITKSMPRTSRKEAQSLFAPLNDSADLLDSKRREFKSAVQKSTEKFRTSTHVSKRQRRDSDESFFCSGDPASSLNSHDRLLPNAHPAESQWPPRAQSRNLCRLCRVQNPAGIRGICIECENTYCIRLPDNVDDSYATKPTLPLKVQKFASPVPGMSNRTPKVLDSPPSVLSLEANQLKKLKINNVGVRKPTVVATAFRHQASHRVVVGRVESSGKQAMDRSAHWPPGEIRDTYKRSKIQASVRPSLKSTEYGSSTYSCPDSPRLQHRNPPYSSKGEHLSLSVTRTESSCREGDAVMRGESPYAFYEPLLRDHGIRTPNFGKPLERYNDL